MRKLTMSELGTGSGPSFEPIVKTGQTGQTSPQHEHVQPHVSRFVGKLTQRRLSDEGHRLAALIEKTYTDDTLDANARIDANTRADMYTELYSNYTQTTERIVNERAPVFPDLGYVKPKPIYTDGPTLVGVTRPLPVDTTVKHKFDAQHARNYFVRCFRRSSVRVDSNTVDTSRNGVAPQRLPTLTLAEQTYHKASSSTHDGATSQRTYDVDWNTIDDLVQEAFLKWHTMRNKETTRQCCGYVLRQHFRVLAQEKNLRRRYLRHCIGINVDAGNVHGVNNTDMANWEKHVEFLNGNFKWRADVHGEKDEKIFQTLREWLATGASQSDVAAALGVNRKRISEAVARMRLTTDRPLARNHLGHVHADVVSFMPQTPIERNATLQPAQVYVAPTYSYGKVNDHSVIDEETYYRSQWYAGMSGQTQWMNCHDSVGCGI